MSCVHISATAQQHRHTAGVAQPRRTHQRIPAVCICLIDVSSTLQQLAQSVRITSPNCPEHFTPLAGMERGTPIAAPLAGV